MAFGITLGFLHNYWVIANDAPAIIKTAGNILNKLLGTHVQVCDGTADDVQIQAAWDALSSGGKLVLSSGTFNCGTLDFDDTNYMTLEGQGNSTIIKQPDDNDESAFYIYFDNCDHCTFQDFRIQPNLDNQTDKGTGTVRIGDVNYSHFDRIWVDGSLGAEDGFNFMGGTGNTIFHCTFTDCDETDTSCALRFNDISQAGVYSTYNMVSECYFNTIGEHAIKGYGNGSGTLCHHNSYTRNVVIAPATLSASKVGIWVSDYDCALNNYIDMTGSASNYAIQMYGIGASAIGNTLVKGRIEVENVSYYIASNNYIDMVAVNVMAITVVNGDYGTVTGNQIDGISADGDIYVDADSTGNIFANNVSQNSTKFVQDLGTDNMFLDNHAAASSTLAATTIYKNNKGGGYGTGDIGSIYKVIDHASLTDNADATAYMDFTDAIPAGSIIKGVKCDFTEAFNSDDTTTLTMMIGYVGDLDAFNKTADPGENAFNHTTDVYWGESDCQNHVVTSATTTRVTFTEDDDGTDIISSANAQGAVTVTITFLKI